MEKGRKYVGIHQKEQEKKKKERRKNVNDMRWMGKVWHKVAVLSV